MDNQTVGLWYCSFAGEEGFRGAVITEGDGGPTMVMKMHLLGINPGGEILMHPFPTNVPNKWKDRLLTKEDIMRFDAEMGYPEN